MSVFESYVAPSAEAVDDYAEHAYRAYNASTGGMNDAGQPCPLWAHLGDVQKDAWRASTSYLHMAFTKGTLPAPGWPPLNPDAPATNDV